MSSVDIEIEFVYDVHILIHLSISNNWFLIFYLNAILADLSLGRDILDIFTTLVNHKLTQALIPIRR